MSSSKTELRLTSLDDHTSIEASSPTSSSKGGEISKRGCKLKVIAAFGVLAIVAFSGVALVRSIQHTNPQGEGQAEIHSQSFEGLATCSAVWGQCGGRTWTGPTCCSGGSFCSAQSEFYSQCLPASSTPFPPFTTQPPPTTPSPTTAGCVADWGQCGGVNYHGSTCCAKATSKCSIQSDWYSQCLPAGTTPFPWVDYSFNQIENGVVFNPRTTFNGLLSGGATKGPGYEGQGIVLDGIDGKVRVKNSESWDFSSSGFTLSAAVKRSTAVDEDGIITKWFTPDNFLLKFDGNSLIFTVHFVTAGYKTITLNFGSDTSYLGQWGFVKASYQRSGSTGSIIRLWWNGELVGTVNVADNMIVPSSMPVLVGNTNNDFSFFKGTIDNVRIWNAAV